MALLFCVFYFAFLLDSLHVFWAGATLAENVETFRQLGISLGDGLLYETGGMLPLTWEELTDNFVFPVRWLLPHILALYITLGYPGEDLGRGGIQVMTRTRSKRMWWLSKCLWNILTVISCFAAGLAAWFLLSLATGRVMDFSFNEKFFEMIFGGELSGRTASAWSYAMALCVLPVVVCAACSLMQMTLALFIRPVFAYMALCVYYIAGAYYANPLFISNYAMSARSAAVGLYNFRAGTGLLLCLVFSLTAVVTGAVRLEKMDIGVNMR